MDPGGESGPGRRRSWRGAAHHCSGWCEARARPPCPCGRPGGVTAPPALSSPCGPQGDGELTALHRHAVLRIVTDTDVRLWRRVHMDLVRYAGCVCRPSC
ncbi:MULTISPECIES: putative leader peptide [unclassified Streptomyces]|uniref:putative leader peptide n=1 Tax=unclassified Streptomyces TaxID=2593676 RepID=UPI003519EB6F